MKSNDLHVRHDPKAGISPQTRTRRWWLGPIIWAALLFVASSIPGTMYPVVGFAYADKVVHTCIYGTLGALLAIASRMTKPWRRHRVWLFAVGAATLYGATDELHQLFVPKRSADLRDLLADFVGASLGAAMALVVVSARERNKGRRLM